ncbi:MAG TPA: hypothetical protein DGM69_00065 [Chloroflexi bacterium]|nr:hypothetical protein [Chloroflexota bacterium]|tara:strand:- start:4808 stop:6388 length:1581 start_codon:yes stop_codon:yes gene_type:complete
MKKIFTNKVFVLNFSAALLVIGSLAHYWMGYFHYDWSGDAWGTDDAYITYRYAENLANGNGIVFNPGDPVEGYSNLLYLLLLTPVFLVGASTHVYVVSVVLNICFGIGALYVFANYTRDKFGNTNGSLAAFVFVLTPPLWMWISSGMETILIVFLVLLLMVYIERIIEGAKDLRILSLLLICISMARADGFVIASIVIFYLFLKGCFREMWWSLMVVVCTLSAYSIWRLYYYGDLLPNTYYAKVSGPLIERVVFAVRQLWGISMNEGLFVYLLVAVLVFVQVFSNLYRKAQLENQQLFKFETVFIFAWIFYWIYIGADHFVERFLVVLYPLGLIALFRYIGSDLGGRGRIFIVSMLIILQLRMVVLDDRFLYTFHKYDRNIELGQMIKEEYEGKLLASDAAGKIPFYSGLQTIDMLGLNDRHIARIEPTFFEVGHNKFDPDYVLSLCPDLIVNWVKDRDMNLVRGVTRDKYEGFYRWAYLLNASRESKDVNIVNVSNVSLNDVQKLLDQEYSIAVLEKVKCKTLFD